MRDYAMIREALIKDLRPFVRDRGHIGFACRAQLRNFYKKLSPTDRIGEKAEAAALKKFMAVNSQIPDTFSYEAEVESDERFFRYLKRILWEATDWLMDDDAVNLTSKDLSRYLAVGPGASLGVNSSNFYTKLFDGTLTATSPHVLARYRAALCETDSWFNAERQRYERFGDTIVEGNKLFFVPKNVDTARSCCTEPAANMILQKMIGGFLEYRLKRFFGIDLSIQPAYNRSLCKIGSSNGTFGTIDLSSASDSISWALCQAIFPPALVGLMDEARSPISVLPDGNRLRLKMVSTMGNGFTFPLETLLFAAVVRAVYHVHGFPCTRPDSHFAVFGDDLIVRTECYDDVVRQLGKLGFEVNAAKSFKAGPFRESCGEDYWNGINVRSVYIRTLETPSSIYSALNRLTVWSARLGVPLVNTVQLLKSLVRFRPIPFFEDDSAGFKVPSSFIGQVRGNYTCLEPRPKRTGAAECPEEAPKFGYLDYNHDGWMTTFLAGHIRTRGGAQVKGGSFFTERTSSGQRTSYKVARRSTPFWDWPGPRVSYASYHDWEVMMAAFYR